MHNHDLECIEKYNKNQCKTEVKIITCKIKESEIFSKLAKRSSRQAEEDNMHLVKVRMTQTGLHNNSSSY